MKKLAILLFALCSFFASFSQAPVALTVNGTLSGDTSLIPNFWQKVREVQNVTSGGNGVTRLLRSLDSNLLVEYSTGIVDTFKIFGGSGSGGSTDLTATNAAIALKQNTAPNTQVITSGTTATIANGTTWVIIDPSIALATLTITLPANPTLQEIKFSFGGTINAAATTVVNNLVIIANSGQSLVGSGAIGIVDTEDTFGIRINSSKWYRQ